MDRLDAEDRPSVRRSLSVARHRSPCAAHQEPIAKHQQPGNVHQEPPTIIWLPYAAQ